jgi:uncharacterized LabA/DUF88 family protein
VFSGPLTHVSVDIYDDYSHHWPHIRPSGVRPLNHPERVQKAWGFPFWGGHMRVRRIAILIDGVSHHPILNRRIEFGKSEVASFRRALFSELRHKRKFALRLGHVTKESDWYLSPRLTRQVLKIGKWVEHIEAALLQAQSARLSALGEAGTRELQEFIAAWREISERDVNFGLRQKGVDMRIGLDIASMTLKHQVDTLVLVTGDSDFVPAAKLARREGVEFLLDPRWQQVSDELNEHVDGVVSAFHKPAVAGQARIAA